jgi:hypothetical protein
MQQPTAVLVTLLAFWLGSCLQIALADGQPWINARSTFYGRDRWSLHTGSCGYGEQADGFALLRLTHQRSARMQYHTEAFGDTCGRVLPAV